MVAALVLAAFLSGAAGAERYRVVPGDTLTSIASRFGTSVHALSAANRRDPARTLLIGTVLRIPAGPQSAYRVRVGDTLSGLARRFGTSLRALAAANHIDPNGVLFAGITLKVPGGGVTSGATPTMTSTYRVALGDSLSAIAARFGTTVGALAAANHLDPARVLLADSVLAVPGGATPTTTTARPPLSHGQVRTLIVSWAGRYGVDAPLALALSWMESGYQATVVSPAGAFGPMQVTPATRDFVEAVLLGTPVPRTTSGDVQAGVVYLRYLLQRFGGDERLALAGYFQGPEGVRGGLLPATRVYVANVLALKSRV
jgi:N-acetylmuramoyl-L-alanine amidase